MRLIDAEVLARFIDFGHLRNPNEKAYSENDIREMIDMCVTIDAPARHGRWVVIDAEEPRRYGCSECKRLSWNMENYCGNCGARMDGESNE